MLTQFKIYAYLHAYIQKYLVSIDIIISFPVPRNWSDLICFFFPAVDL